MKYTWPIIKTIALVSLYISLRYVFNLQYLWAIGICLCTILFYQEIVALYFGVIAIPIMDQTMLMSSGEHSLINGMNAMCFDCELDIDLIVYNLKKLWAIVPKW